MAISTFQALVVTNVYSLGRRAGLLNSGWGQKLFIGSYFLYKKYVEDPFAGMARLHPELFRGGDILDVGANIGYTASVFAGACDPDAQVYAFEPEAFNFELLGKVIRSRRLANRVTAVHSAVGDRTGEIQLWINDNHHADHRVATDTFQQGLGGQKCVSVPLTSVDDFLAGRRNCRSVSFIKIDVQGYELPVCLGMLKTLDSHPGAVVTLEYMPEALTALGFHPEEILTLFREREFHMYSLGQKGELTPDARPELETKGYVDLVFSRRLLG